MWFRVESRYIGMIFIRWIWVWNWFLVGLVGDLRGIPCALFAMQLNQGKKHGKTWYMHFASPAKMKYSSY